MRAAEKIKERAKKNLGVCDPCNFKRSTASGLYVHCQKRPGEHLPAWEDGNCPMDYWKQAKGELPVKRLKYLFVDNDGKQHLSEAKPDYWKQGFLLCNGPSMPAAAPFLPRIVTMGLNNCPFYTTHWCCVDNPSSFPDVAWRWETTHYVPVRRMGELPEAAKERNVYGYNEYTGFKWWRFLAEERINWGNQTMMIAVRILFDLGIRELFIVGADFSMEAGEGAYGDGRSANEAHAANNNRSYAMLNDRFGLLRPLLEKHGMKIWNCTPGSKLTAFETMGYDEAVERCSYATVGENTKA